MVSINLEKACDKEPRDLNFWTLRKKCVYKGNIQIIENIYKEAKTSVRSRYGETSEF